MNNPHSLQAESRLRANASDERLDVIESNECSYQENSLSTKRFRAVFNALAEVLKDRGQRQRGAAVDAKIKREIDGIEHGIATGRLNAMQTFTFMRRLITLSCAPVARDGLEELRALMATLKDPIFMIQEPSKEYVAAYHAAKRLLKSYSDAEG